MSFLAAKSEAAQTQFVREEENRFLIASKRDLMLGRWAGQMLGFSGEALEDYAEKIMRAALLEPNGALQAIASDFRLSRLPLAVTLLPEKADEYREEAERTLKVA